MDTTTTLDTGLRRAHCAGGDARTLARQFHAAVRQPDMASVVFFCSPELDLEALADELRRLFADVLLVGCTTAGEIGQLGYRDGSITGISFSRRHFRSLSYCAEDLASLPLDAYADAVQALRERLEVEAPFGPGRTFGVLLIDGLSRREETLTHAIQAALGAVKVVGGSAGDGLDFGRTFVFADGAFRSNVAVLLLMTTDLPFRVFKTQHFEATGERLVVTAADPETRTVYEINGRLAAPEYARLVGLTAADLSPGRFASWPVVVVIDGTNYVRSIQRANPDGSLTFFCAIETGLVLRVAHGVDLVRNLDQALRRLSGELGPLSAVLAFDCILRKLEVVQRGATSQVAELLAAANVTGFNTYGEQYRGVHVNQTFVGVAFGASAEAFP